MIKHFFLLLRFEIFHLIYMLLPEMDYKGEMKCNTSAAHKWLDLPSDFSWNMHASTPDLEGHQSICRIQAVLSRVYLKSYRNGTTEQNTNCTCLTRFLESHILIV